MPVDFKEYGRRMEKSLEHLGEEFGAVRAGRANAKVLDRISVEYYGSETPLNGVATISSPDARTLVVAPWDTKLLKEIQKAIQTSDLGINPQNDGKVIRLTFPQLTEERRKELTKQRSKPIYQMGAATPPFLLNEVRYGKNHPITTSAAYCHYHGR